MLSVCPCIRRLADAERGVAPPPCCLIFVGGQVSLLAGLSPDKHLKIGAALRGLMEDEGVLVVGSGQVNMILRVILMDRLTR